MSRRCEGYLGHLNDCEARFHGLSSFFVANLHNDAFVFAFG